MFIMQGREGSPVSLGNMSRDETRKTQVFAVIALLYLIFKVFFSLYKLSSIGANTLA